MKLVPRPAAASDAVAAAMRLHVRRLGRRRYEDALALQQRAAQEVAAGGPDVLFLLEHPRLVTLGRGADPTQLLASPDALRRRGVAVLETSRGGGATYHGPGQVVGYPIIDLRRRGLGVRAYLRVLEAALLAALRAEGLSVFRRPGLTGVWSAAGKVVSIGIGVRRGITRHGFALNVDTDLSAFELIVPCGLRQPVTSMAALGWKGSRPRLLAALAAHLDEHLATFVEGRPTAPVDGCRPACRAQRPPRRHGRACAAGVGDPRDADAGVATAVGANGTRPR